MCARKNIHSEERNSLMKKLIVSDTIKASTDIYVEFLTGMKQRPVSSSSGRAQGDESPTNRPTTTNRRSKGYFQKDNGHPSLSTVREQESGMNVNVSPLSSPRPHKRFNEPCTLNENRA